MSVSAAVKDRLSRASYDAIVIGSGPNGLAAAITVAQKGRSVIVLEAQPTLGGGARTAELTLPGFKHDLCSAIHPMAVASPFFRSLPLAEHGLEWIHPPAPLAHPLDDGTAAMLERPVGQASSMPNASEQFSFPWQLSLHATCATLGPDAVAYRRLMEPLLAANEALFEETLRPLRFPHHPLLLMAFGFRAIRSARALANSYFRGREAKALLAGLAGHAILPLDQTLSAAVAVMLGLAGHAVGWPLPRGGSQSITNALISYLKSLGGEVLADCRVDSLADLPPARAYFFDTSPRAMSQIGGDKLPAGFRHKLERFRYGPGVFKLDWALSRPIPWRAPECSRAATLHLGGTLDEIASSEQQVFDGKHPDKPYVLLAQQSLFDSTRAPEGKHTGWAYCHVPAGSTVDMTETIERQVERFAPGFRDCILARSKLNTTDVHHHNANYIGGDIACGSMTLLQTFLRPTSRLYTTPNPSLFLCSSSTPPGPGVHGLCGSFAAQAALRSALK
jgi:phytoene dehydrogenase-like protein